MKLILYNLVEHNDRRGVGKLRPAERFLQFSCPQCALLAFFVLIEYH